MENYLEKLNEISEYIKRVNSKVILLNLLNRAKEQYDKFDYESCRQTLEEILSQEPQNPVALRGIGCIEQFENKFDSAMNYFNKALEFSENKEIEYTLIGMLYYIQDKLEEAVKYFNLAIDLNDEYTLAFEGRNQAMLENHLRIIDLQESLKKYF